MENRIESETIFPGLLAILTSYYGRGNMMLPWRNFILCILQLPNYPEVIDSLHNNPGCPFSRYLRKLRDKKREQFWLEYISNISFFSMGMVLIPVSCTISWTSIHSSSGSLSIRSSSLNLFLTSTVRDLI